MGYQALFEQIFNCTQYHAPENSIWAIGPLSIAESELFLNNMLVYWENQAVLSHKRAQENS